MRTLRWSVVGAGAFLVPLAGLVGWGCGPSGPEPGLGRAASPIVGGTEDPGASAVFPAVVNVEFAPAFPDFCSGTMLTDQLVLTDAHCLNVDPVGCAPSFSTDQGPTVHGPRALVLNKSDMTANFLSQSGTVDVYRIDAIRVHPGAFSSGVDAATCCTTDHPPNLQNCRVCNYTGQGPPAAPPIPFTARAGLNDVAVVHLDRPVTNTPGVVPMQAFLQKPKPWQPADPTQGIFDFDFTTGPAIIGTLVGTSGTTNFPNQRHRAFGSGELVATNGTSQFAGDCAGSTAASHFATSPTGFIQVLAAGPALPDGGACTVGGDSGGPLVLNALVPNATPFAAFGLDAVVVANNAIGSAQSTTACNDAISKETTISDNPMTLDGAATSTNNGTFIQREMADFDNDGIPDSKDNCPFTPNADQANCNQDAEDARGYRELGDACDPTPCPLATPDTAAPVTAGYPVVVEGQFIVSPSICVQDKLEVTPIGWSDVHNGADLGKTSGQHTVKKVDTDYRFCQIDTTAVPPVTCGQEVVNDKFLTAPPPSTKGPDPMYPFLPVAMQKSGNKALFSHETLDYPSSETRTWDYKANYDSWTCTNQPAGCVPKINKPVVTGCTPGFPCTTGLNGVFWLHGASNVGQPKGGTGEYHPLADGETPGPVLDPDELANHYFPLAPDAPCAVPIEQIPLLELPPPYFFWRWAPDPGPPLGYLGSPQEDAFFMSEGPGTFGLVRPGGLLFDVTPDVGTGLERLLADTTVTWVSASEPLLAIGPEGAAGGFQALAFRSDGTPFDGVLRRGLRIGATEDFDTSFPSAGDGPPRRTGFTALYSRHEQAALVLGGLDVAGAPLHDIWMRPVGRPGVWGQVVVPGYELGTVRAAVWSWHDRRLWVLDEHPLPQLPDGLAQTELRLARIDPGMGVAEIAGTWRPTHAWDRQYLAIDRDGQVLLVSAKDEQYAVARLVVTPFQPLAPVTVEQLEILRGNLAAPPLVDRKGYGFLLRGATTLSLVRKAALDGSSIELAALGRVL